MTINLEQQEIYFLRELVVRAMREDSLVAILAVPTLAKLPKHERPETETVRPEPAKLPTPGAASIEVKRVSAYPFNCQYCGKGFPYKSTFKRHRCPTMPPKQGVGWKPKRENMDIIAMLGAGDSIEEVAYAVERPKQAIRAIAGGYRQHIEALKAIDLGKNPNGRFEYLQKHFGLGLPTDGSAGNGAVK